MFFSFPNKISVGKYFGDTAVGDIGQLKCYECTIKQKKLVIKIQKSYM